MYRLRKKQLTQGIKSSVNEVLHTPSTSNSRMTLEPSPQPVTTGSVSPTLIHSNNIHITVQVEVHRENSPVQYDHRLTPENVP
ncbi:hypothetical protein KQX54_017230 [Cotesia glomerata]|uniref:Uncharacterized protein n=1 Tax=Cotesia glomerata TaxID=32391 RepID=A0AAV7I616_COTGL|nr:hypothetical protein KQX54_017230 [Cotesia glomerata]